LAQIAEYFNQNHMFKYISKISGMVGVLVTEHSDAISK